MHPAGFRLVEDQGPWPPDPDSINVFLFGGSTAFGYRVSDDESIASRLQDHLTGTLDSNVRLYNFGRGYYYSTQERILFEQLLAQGIVPSVAVFLDGLNDFYYTRDEPEFTRLFRRAVRPAGERRLFEDLAVVRLSHRIRAKLSSRSPEGPTSAHAPSTDADVEYVIQRYRANKKLIGAAARAYGVHAIFVWQPVPTYGYDLRHHLFAEEGFGRHALSGPGYRRMHELLLEDRLGDDFLWAADLQEGARGPLYNDRVHYTAEFNRRLAVHIGDELIARGVLGGSARPQSSPGGAPSALPRDR